MVFVKLNSTFHACKDTSFTDTVYVFSYPVVDLGPDTSICSGQAAITLTNLQDSATDYHMLWSTGEITANIYVNIPGIYWLSTENNDCITTDSVIVKPDCYIAIPNAFSPNGDGVNDYFFPRELLSRGITSFHMQIFSRWGQMVFEADNINGRGWDGTFNGVSQPESVYIYTIEATYANDIQKKYKGNVTLIR